MPPGVNRFNPQILSGPFSHAQQPHLQHHASQHQAPTSNLPPPSFNTHHNFNQNNQNSNLNSFSQLNTNGLAAGFGNGGGIGGGGTGLASREAQMGFMHGAALQERQLAREQMRRSSGGSGAKSQLKGRIRDVWRGNLAQEMQALRGLIEKYPYISMDTEFPGIVARPMGAFTTKADYHYQTLRCNVDLLRVIQLGVTLFSEEGELPPAQPNDGSVLGGTTYQNQLVPSPCTWQFNFQFSIQDDMYNQESIEFLSTAGLDLERNEKDGIDPVEFGAVLISSGLVLLDDVKWISFHSGYDFGYLVKLMLCKPLPEDETEYRKLLSIFFPSIYDIKYMVKHAQRNQAVNDAPLTAQAASILNNLGPKSGLQDLADELGIKRTGNAHQAGSDSLLTGKTFWDVKRNIFNGSIDDEKYLGQVWGLNGVGSSLQPTMTNFPSTNLSGMEEAPNLNGATIYNQLNGNQGPPSTPGSTQPGLANTPSNQHQQNQENGIGTMTPSGGGGVFGNFQYGGGLKR